MSVWMQCCLHIGFIVVTFGPLTKKKPSDGDTSKFVADLRRGDCRQLHNSGGGLQVCRLSRRFPHKWRHLATADLSNTNQ